MPSIHRIIWNKFHVHGGDNPPFCGWKATRVALAELFAELKYKKGVEVGVCQGLFSEVLCQKNPGLQLSCVDPWTPYRLRRKEEQEANYQTTLQRMQQYGATVIRKTSMDAVGDFADNSLDFVYIDGLHDFESVMLDIICWSHKVRPGGIVSGHDYCWGYQAGVVPAVDAYVRGKGILNWYLTVRDREPSWLWVK